VELLEAINYLNPLVLYSQQISKKDIQEAQKIIYNELETLAQSSSKEEQQSDFVHEAMLKLMSRMSNKKPLQFDDVSKLRAYLRKILENQFFEMKRIEQRNKDKQSEVSFHYDNIQQDNNDNILNKEILSNVQAKFDKLLKDKDSIFQRFVACTANLFRRKDRKANLLRDVDDLLLVKREKTTTETLSKQYASSKNAIEKRFSRVRKNLSDSLIAEKCPLNEEEKKLLERIIRALQ